MQGTTASLSKSVRTDDCVRKYIYSAVRTLLERLTVVISVAFLREAAKKVPPLMTWPLRRGGGG